MEEDLNQFVVICRSCGGQKIRKPSGMFANGRDRRWVDHNGKQWNGRKCPDCNRVRSRNNMKKLRKGKTE